MTRSRIPHSCDYQRMRELLFRSETRVPWLSRLMQTRKTIRLTDISLVGVGALEGQFLAGYRVRRGLHGFGFSSGQGVVIRTKQNQTFLFRSDEASAIVAIIELPGLLTIVGIVCLTAALAQRRGEQAPPRSE